MDKDTLVRPYHGCIVVSRPTNRPEPKPPEIGEDGKPTTEPVPWDGWDHELFDAEKNKLGDFPTLAAAIAEAKARKVREFLKEESSQQKSSQLNAEKQ